MPPRAKKTQVSVYLDPPIHGQLADYAARRSLSQSLVAEAAIASFLSPDAAEQREAAIAKRLDQADRRMARLERDVGIAVETLAVRFTVPRLTKDDVAEMKRAWTAMRESADGVLHPDEDRYLAHVSEILGLSQREYRCVRRGFVVDADSPYEVLSVSPAASDKDIKARYRDLVKSHHPDALVAKGVPPEFLAGAERRLAAITAAYEEILSERGLRAERALESSP